MAEGFSLELIMEKGPREGETLKYPSGSLVKIGRVVRGNTIAIKDEGISSKHLCIQFDNNLNKWTLCDLDSSNGTILNGQILKPYVPSGLEDGDCIKIGELTSMIVKINVESAVKPRRNPRRQGKPRATEAGAAAVVVENDITDPVVLIEPRMTRGRKKMSAQVFEDHGLDVSKPADIVVPKYSKRTRAGRKGLPPVEENLNLNDVNKSLQSEEGITAAVDKFSKDSLENVKISTLEGKMDTNNDSAQEQVVNEGSSKGKEVAEESDCRKDDCDGSVKDNGQVLDLEKMTLSDFFDYMEVQLIKEIRDKMEKTISDLKEKDRKCHEFRLQWNKERKD